MESAQALSAPPPLTTAQAAQYLGLSKSSLEHMRVRGDGPVFLRLSPGCIRYEIAALDAWRASKRHRHTAEYAPESKAAGGADAAA